MLHRCNVREWEWEGMRSLMGIPQEWELVTKWGMGMGSNGNRLHGNGREWECKKPFPGISTSNLYEFINADLYSQICWHFSNRCCLPWNDFRLPLNI